MTYKIAPIGKAMTAIAAVLAFASAPSIAQDIVPPEPVVDATNTPATPDPLAPEAADPVPVETNVAVPPAPRPKVETSRTTRTTTARATATNRATGSATRPTARGADTAASTAAPAAAAAVAPAAPAAEPAPPPPAPPPAAAEPAAPAVAEPAPASDTTFMLGLTPTNMLLAAAALLALLALAGAAMVAKRRRRRREEAELEARNQFLDQAEADHAAEEPVLELDRSNEVRPGPVFAQRRAPMHDPLPASRAATPHSDFMFRRAGKPKVEHS